MDLAGFEPASEEHSLMQCTCVVRKPLTRGDWFPRHRLHHLVFILARTSGQTDNPLLGPICRVARDF